MRRPGRSARDRWLRAWLSGLPASERRASWVYYRLVPETLGELSALLTVPATLHSTAGTTARGRRLRRHLRPGPGRRGRPLIEVPVLVALGYLSLAGRHLFTRSTLREETARA